MMMKDHAKFTGELAKGIKIGESSVEIKLLIPLKAAMPHLLFLSSNQGEEVNVFLGDPQAAFDFGEEDEEIYREVTGRRVITDASGVVVDIEKRKEGDPNQVTLFDQEGEEGAADEASEAEAASATDLGEGSPDGQQEGAEPDSVHSDAEQNDVLEPDWLKGEEDGGVTEGEGGSAPSGDNPSDQGEDPGSEEGGAPEEVSKDALEAFILTNRPVYDDIEIDGTPILFPELLQERLELNKTWKEIAQEKEVSPSVLSAKWGAYKKRVERKMIKDGGGAA